MADSPPGDDLVEEKAAPVADHPLRDNLATGLFWYAATSLPVVGVIVCLYLFVNHTDTLAEWFGRWDGVGYAWIVRDGYTYSPSNEPANQTSLMYFPGYPLLGWLLHLIPGVGPELALLLVSHICTAAAFVMLAAYVQVRFPEADATYKRRVLLALGLLPITFAFRMALSEGPFLLVVIATFYAMQRQISVVWIALLIGLAFSIRPVGVSLLPPFWLYLWRQTPNWRPFLLRSCVWTPVACWAPAAFVLYCAWSYGEPFVYLRVQGGMHIPGIAEDNKWLALLTLKPFWGHFVSSAPCYWETMTPGQNPLLNLYLANPIWFGAAIVAVVVGAARRWINISEVLLSAGLFGVPYLTVSHPGCMCSHARYASVVFPVYLVVGQLTGRISRPLSLCLLQVSAILLVVYAGRFAMYYQAHF